MDSKEYWAECIGIAADECGLVLTPEHLDSLAEAVDIGHENYGMAFHQPESPYPSEIKKLEAALRAEREKVTCKTCGGFGTLTTYGGTFQSTSSCWKCHGEGRHAP